MIEKDIFHRLLDLRTRYLATIRKQLLSAKSSKYGMTVSIADVDSRSSSVIAKEWSDLLPKGTPLQHAKPGQKSGAEYTAFTMEYLKESFSLLFELRPGQWVWGADNYRITDFDQYYHLNRIEDLAKTDESLRVLLTSDYIVKPDIVVSRLPIPSELLGERCNTEISMRTPLLEDSVGSGHPIMHASISCKWTMRSDRAQNTKVEAQNLLRNRKGNSPHMVVVTAEPLPTRLASIALGVGDIDCVYHSGLYELIEAVKKYDTDRSDQMDMLNTLVIGRRLRDISDLPFDLAI